METKSNGLINSIEKIFQIIPPVRTLYKCILQRIFKYFIKHKGDNILEEDFDHLIILDACRYDVFKEVNFLEGQLSKKISLGSQTWEWAEKTFKKKYDDVVYITGAPVIKYENRTIKDYITGCVYKIENVWKYNWDLVYRTVLPQKINEVAFRLIRKYPSKRFIIHFVQPHFPSIAPNNKFIKSSQNINEDPFQLVRTGKIKREEILNLYKENLILVLKEVKKLIDGLGGKIIVTSDHGESFGEKFIWGHHSEIHIPGLVEVPWLVIDKPKNVEKRNVNLKINQINI